ncbi:MAG: hypothetical protein QF767_05000, partial [Alphaproteobacteria bacterium]|nr:hypothetical protein [Alphaproteobacteria bacterium]
QHVAVADSAVIGVPNDKWGETTKAILVRAEGAQAKDHELIEFCRERLAAYKCPTSIVWCDSLPKTPSGKVQKAKLRKRYQSSASEMEGPRQ